MVNNYIVNRSIDVHVVERAAGHPIAVEQARTVIRHPNLVTRVDAGQRVQMRERALAPRGTGSANSAPPPPPSVVSKPSTQATPHNAVRRRICSPAPRSAIPTPRATSGDDRRDRAARPATDLAG